MTHDAVIDSRYGEAGHDCPECGAGASQQDWDTLEEVVTGAETLDGYRIWQVACDCGHVYTVKDWRPEEEVARFPSLLAASAPRPR